MKKTLLLLFVCLFVGISHAQAQVTVKGTVISSENNEPVIGASVLVKGTTNGTITDINGQFTLTNISPTNKTIIVSFIGMETQEVTIKPEMKIVMTSTTEVMEEVLVVAYGTAKKSAFTGSAKMIHTEQITKRPVTNVIESLSGQVAGLQMTMTNGQPGETPSILIRGISSMSAKTDPLIVLDGMPYEGGWNNINPADVESISVLKDAASTALYGARGANGVIIITTKSAKAGDAKITVDAKWSANTRGEIEYDYIKDPGEYYQAHYKALYNYYLNAQGQTPDQAYVSANTNMIGTNSQTGGLSYNVYSIQNSAAGGFSQAFNTAPIYPLYLRDTNGKIMQDKNGDMYDFGVSNQGPLNRPINPNSNGIKLSQLDTYNTSANTLNGDAFIDINFLKDFKFTFNAGTSIRDSRYKNALNPFYGTANSLNGSINVQHWRRTTLNLQQILNYNHSFGLHNVSLMAGHESFNNVYEELYAAKNSMFSFFQNQELNGAISGTNDESSYKSKYNTEGYLFRGMYDYDSKYFFQLSYRRDASSRFHPDNRWGNFYSVGTAWILTKEKWLDDIKWLDLLKLKFSVGQQGNDRIDDFLYVDTYNINNSNNELSLGFSRKGNKNITWETNTNINLGIEFELLKGRLSGSIEYFNRRTTDMLNRFSVPLSLGYSGYYDNIGDMNNKGVEIDLKYIPVKTRNVTWNIGFNATHYRNKISRLAESKKTDIIDGHAGYVNGLYYYGEGLPMYTNYVQKYAGVSEEGKPQWYYTDKQTGEMKTTTTYSQADLYLCGDAVPDLYGGINTSLSFYGFDFSTQINYSIGGQAYDYGYQALMSPPTSTHLGYNVHKDIYKAWSPENTQSDIPQWQFNDLYSVKTSDRFLTNASSISIQNIQLGYTFSKKTLRSLYLTNLRIYVACDNVYYWSKRKGFDSRVTWNGNKDSSGEYSAVRAFSAGLSLQF